MSGFDAGWLDLREPADHRSLARPPLERLAALLGDKDEIAVADLGAGSGSLLRALAPRLGPRQRWTVIEHDPRLIGHARTRLAEWAEACETEGDALLLRRGGRRIEVVFAQADLSADPLPAEAACADLVTAAAFFDLVGAEWLQRFVAALAGVRRPLYAPLIYSGRKSFAPPHASDGETLAAFNRHQRGDKGFGPALGPGAPAALSAAAVAAGYAVVEGDSPWRLDRSDAALIGRLVDGVAAANAELGDAPGLAAWLAIRRAATESAEVSHADLWIEPG